MKYEWGYSPYTSRELKVSLLVFLVLIRDLVLVLRSDELSIWKDTRGKRKAWYSRYSSWGYQKKENVRDWSFISFKFKFHIVNICLYCVYIHLIGQTSHKFNSKIIYLSKTVLPCDQERISFFTARVLTHLLYLLENDMWYEWHIFY